MGDKIQKLEEKINLMKEELHIIQNHQVRLKQMQD